jgi:hypothetical protein
MEDDRLSGRQLDLAHPLWMLVHKEPEIGSRLMCCFDRQEDAVR